MKVFDTHAHLDDEKYDEDRETILKQCKQQGVELMINAGADIASSLASIRLANENDFIYATVGVHPHDAKSWDKDSGQTLNELAKNPKVVAIGEIGLDYYYDFSPRELQKKVFAEQILLARALKMPVMIHDRDSHEDTMTILKANKAGEWGCVLHSFSGSVEMARECVKRGYFLSIGGPLTFKNNRKTIEVVREIPLDHLFIETDSPYLTPEPYRGKRNVPYHVIEVAKKIAEIKNMEPEEVAQVTMENAKKFFNI